MFYLKLVLMILWGLFSTSLGCLYGLFRFRHPDVFRQTLKLQAWGILQITGMQLNVQGSENLNSQQPCLYFGNHQSAFDVVLFGWCCPRNCIVVAKKEVLWIPIIGLFFLVGGTVFLDRKKREKAIEQLGSALKVIREKGRCVAMFPEGTRNRSGHGMLPFKRGPFHLALAAQVPIVPMVAAELGDRVNFKKRLLIPGPLQMRILPPISTRGLSEKDLDALTEKVHQAMCGALKEIS